MQRRAKKELFGPHMIVIAMLVARKRLVEDFENLHLTFCYLLFSDHFSEFFTSPILVQTISLSPLYLWSVHCNPSQVQRRSLVWQASFQAHTMTAEPFSHCEGEDIFYRAKDTQHTTSSQSHCKTDCAEFGHTGFAP